MAGKYVPMNPWKTFPNHNHPKNRGWNAVGILCFFLAIPKYIVRWSCDVIWWRDRIPRLPSRIRFFRQRTVKNGKTKHIPGEQQTYSRNVNFIIFGVPGWEFQDIKLSCHFDVLGSCFSGDYSRWLIAFPNVWLWLPKVKLCKWNLWYSYNIYIY